MFKWALLVILFWAASNSSEPWLAWPPALLAGSLLAWEMHQEGKRTRS